MAWEKYKVKVKEALDTFKFDEEIISVLKNSIKKNQKIFIGGNGGSAAIANHYTCDLSKGANQDWSQNFRRYQAICLSSNISYMTAISNDEHYQDVFRHQLINLASPNDILILISGSGNSPNVIRAAEFAKEKGMIIIGITGFAGGKLKDICHYSAHLNTKCYEICEDIHGIFGHFLTSVLKNENDSHP